MLFRKQPQCTTNTIPNCLCFQDEYIHPAAKSSHNQPQTSKKISIKSNYSKSSKSIKYSNQNINNDITNHNYQNKQIIPLNQQSIITATFTPTGPNQSFIVSSKNLQPYYHHKAVTFSCYPTLYHSSNFRHTFKPMIKNTTKRQPNINYQSKRQIPIQQNSSLSVLKQKTNNKSISTLHLTKDTNKSKDTFLPLNTQQMHFKGFKHAESQYLQKNNYLSQIPYQSQLGEAKLTISLAMKKKNLSKSIIGQNHHRQYFDKDDKTLMKSVNTIQSQLVEGEQSLKGSVLSKNFQLKKRQKMSQLLTGQKFNILQIL